MIEYCFDNLSLDSIFLPLAVFILLKVKKVKIGRRIIVGWYKIFEADFLLLPMMQKRLKKSFNENTNRIKNPVSIWFKYPCLPMLNSQWIQGLLLLQAKNTKMNCPEHIPSQPPPAPNILATPFFNTLASPRIEEKCELKRERMKNVDFGFTAE